MSGTPSLRPSAYKLKVGGIFPQCGIEQICEGFHPKQTIPSKGEIRLSQKKAPFCGRDKPLPKKELSALGSGVTLTDLFSPTSGRDASHHCLISIKPKEGCTNHV